MHRLKQLPLSIALSLVLVASFLAGCNQGGGKTSTTSPAATTTTVVTTSSTTTTSTQPPTTPTPTKPAGPQAIPASQLEDELLLNELFFELPNYIGKKIWVVGYYGDGSFTGDGVGFLVDNFQRLKVDEVLPRETFARLDGTLPPSSLNGSEVMVYGEIKDFAKTYKAFVTQPTPLITVTKYQKLGGPVATPGWTDSYRLATSYIPAGGHNGTISLTVAPQAAWFAQSNGPTKPDSGDHTVIISGGVDANNNHARYKDNVIAKYKKMKDLGMTDGQIDVFYDDGTPIDVGGANITDSSATKKKLQDEFAGLIKTMSPSSTLTIFVTDHGTGYNDQQGYNGARPALSGPEATSGKLYDENTFKMDARAKTYKVTDAFEYGGSSYKMAKRANGKVELYRREGGAWVFKGTDANGDGVISEAEAGDLDGNGTIDPTGLSVAWMTARLGADWRHQDNEWDTDGDGTVDVRLRWDGTRYVAERLDGGTWKEMGRDTNGDFVIDSTDGGVDWNLDGNKNGKIGFHEGVNLWGKEVLWDDEFAQMMKDLNDHGIHVLIEMVSCFSGGFVPNVQPYVESIVAGSAEDEKHTNRIKDGKAYAADELAFLQNLNGIDPESWSSAWKKAVEADQAAWKAEGGAAVDENHPTTYTKPILNVPSAFQASGDDYSLYFNFPKEMQGLVYDMEFIFGLQNPKWTWGGFPQGLPDGVTDDLVPGGIRITSKDPLPAEFWITVRGTKGADKVRVQLTDKAHSAMGYVMVGPGTVPAQPVRLPVTSTGRFRHTVPGAYSEVFVDVTGTAGTTATLTLTTTTGMVSDTVTKTVTLDATGKATISWKITQYGKYDWTGTVGGTPVSGSVIVQ